MALPVLANNTPSTGQISWEAFVVKYEGSSYSVSAGSTSQRWVWWAYNSGAPVLQAGPSIPDTLTDDDLVLFKNQDGLGVRIQATSMIQGELLVDGTVLADAIAANQLNSNHIVTTGLDAGVIKFGTMSGERIEAESITALQLAADSVTTKALKSKSVTTETLATDAIQADMIRSGNLEAVLALLGSLTVGDPEGRRIVMHPLVGFMLVDDNGDPLVHFPLTESELNRFTGDLVAQGFTALGAAQFRGIDNEISINSAFTLASGLTKPSNQPSIDPLYRDTVPVVLHPSKTSTPWDAFTRDGYSEYDRTSPRFSYASVEASLAALSGLGGTGAWAGKHHQLSKVRMSNNVQTKIPLTYSQQHGFVNYDARVLDYIWDLDDNVMGTDAERALMTAPGSFDSYQQTPWALLEDERTFWNYNSDGSSSFNMYVQMPSGARTLTYQVGLSPERHPRNQDSRPILTGVKIWHYNKDARRYNSKVEISADGTTWTTIFDSAVSGTYPESPSGKTHTFPAQRVMLVRETLNGSTVNGNNHWTEMQVVGWSNDDDRTVGWDHSVPIRIGNFWYIAYKTGDYNSREATGSNVYRIGRFDLNGNQVQVFDYTPLSYVETNTQANFWPNIELATDGVDLIVGQVRPTDGFVRFQHFAPGVLSAPYKTVFTTSQVFSPGNTDMPTFLAGVFDLNVYVYMIKVYSGMRAYSDTGVRASQYDWELGGSSDVETAWNGVRFLVFNENVDFFQTTLYKGSEEIRAAFTWYDSDTVGGTHETDVGPVARTTRKPRYGVKVTVNVPPPDAGSADSPDTSRIYVKQGTYTSTADLDLQPNNIGTMVKPATKFVDNPVTGAAPPPANTFPNGVAAQLLSEIGGFILKGDGTGDWPYLRQLIQVAINAAAATVDTRVTNVETALDSRLDVLEANRDPRKVGEITIYYGTKAQCPTGFLVMDGSVFSSSSYPALAAYLGTTTLPNMSGRVPRQPAVGQVGKELGGSDSVTMPDHTHGLSAGETAGVPSGGGGGQRMTGAGQTGPVTGTNPPISNIPSYLAVWHAIKAV